MEKPLQRWRNKLVRAQKEYRASGSATHLAEVEFCKRNIAGMLKLRKEKELRSKDIAERKRLLKEKQRARKKSKR